MLHLDQSKDFAVETLTRFKEEVEKCNSSQLKGLATKVRVFLSSFPTFNGGVLDKSLFIYEHADHSEQVKRVLGTIEGAIPVFQSGQPFFNTHNQPLVKNTVSSSSNATANANAVAEVLKDDLNRAIIEYDKEENKKEHDPHKLLDAALKVVKIVKAVAAFGLFT